MARLRIAPGWITEAVLLASSSYLIVNFTVQTDQNWPWLEPEYEVMHRFRQSPTIDDTLNEDGPFVMKMTFERLTDDQRKYISSNLLTQASGAWGYVTVYWPDINGDMDAYQGILHKPNEASLRPTDRRGMAPDNDVLYSVVYNFVGGVAV